MKLLNGLGLLLVIAILFAGCKKDEEGSLTVVFKPTFDGTPLVTTDIYDYAFGQKIQFTRSEFFISNLKLVDGSGNAVDLTDIDLIDMTATSSSAAQEGVRLTFNGIPAQSYKRLEFGIGVDSDVNKTLPTDYPSSSPLSDAGRYWTAWSSFIFGKTEGNLDTVADGTNNLDLGWLFHTGTDAYYINVSVTGDINVTDGGAITVTGTLDHKLLMGLPNDPVDIKKKPVNHNPAGNEEEYDKFVANYANAMTFSIQ